MSSYEAFSVLVRDANGVIDDVGAGVSVEVRVAGAGSDAAESPLTTIANGVISAGTLAGVPVGSRVRFRVDDLDGKSASITQITT